MITQRCLRTAGVIDRGCTTAGKANFMPVRRRLVSATLAVTALLAMVAGYGSTTVFGQAPPVPPHVFFGSPSAIVVDGEPYNDVDVIEAVNANSSVVAVAYMNAGFWFMNVPAATGDVRFRVGTATSDIFTVTAGALTSDVVLTLESTGQSAAGAPVALFQGTNTITYTGAAGAPPQAIQDVLANPAALDAVYAWDAASQSWRSWRPGVASFLNTLTTLAQNTPLVVMLNSATVYEASVLGHDAGAWALAPGITVIAFLGADGTSVADAGAFAISSNSIATIYRFDALTQTYEIYRAAGPAFANTLATLNRFDVLFVDSAGASTWPFDAFSP